MVSASPSIASLQCTCQGLPEDHRGGAQAQCNHRLAAAAHPGRAHGDVEVPRDVEGHLLTQLRLQDGTPGDLRNLIAISIVTVVDDWFC